MIIPINDNYRLATDKRQWIIQEPRLRKIDGVKTLTWESKHFFANPESTVNFLGKMMVRESDAETLVDALAEIDRVATELTQALTVEFDVKRRLNHE